MLRQSTVAGVVMFLTGPFVRSFAIKILNTIFRKRVNRHAANWHTLSTG